MTFARSLGTVRVHLTQLNRQPLSRAALVIVLLLDAFVLSSIFDGLARHTAQLAQPYEAVPARCRDIVLDRQWTPAGRLEQLGEVVNAHTAASAWQARASGVNPHPVCAPVVGAIDAVLADGALAKRFDDARALRRQSADLRTQIERLKGSYDTALLEKIAGAEAPTRADTLGRELAAKTGALEEATGRLAQLEAAIAGEARVQALWQRIDAVQADDRERLRADLRQLETWYPVRRLGWELLFLAPLLGLFYAWNAASIRRGRAVQTLVSAHLLVVAFIPVLCKLLQLVYDILPRRFLRQLMMLLESAHLVALWNYLVIALAVAASLTLIYVVQNKLFARDKLLSRRIARGQCQDCGLALPPDSAFCPACGFGQFAPCPHCGLASHVHGRYCRECGQAMGRGSAQ
ncbi:MAG: zinc ribbon domain-containing protein [Immundisolibacter sp.]|uniref:zinc ribbon domain-containing protein n=1 Tax=Immundisolibacter sp. TaxID=1934948 RepID=UPI00198946E1|nr:zinc ribbon domain-containing protein [Immundisolibacter sp.]MBC7160890.1 zinc ribbon domain-containing protein [Immundisolibacter sp.]